MRNFFKSASFLVVAGLVAKALGAIYKIPLVTVLGAEGAGIYQLVFPIYTTLLTISSGGIPQAVSRQTARALAGGNVAESRKVLAVSLVFLSIVGLVGSALMAGMSGLLASLQGNSTATTAYLALSPSVFLVCVLSAFRGWWQGMHDMFPTALSQLMEQIIKLVVGLFLAYKLLPYGLSYGVAGATLGISVSEFFALISVLIYSLLKRKKPILTNNFVTEELRSKGLIKELLKSALPISFGSLVLPLTQLIDSVLVVNILTAKGFSITDATSLYGLSGAPVSAIINLFPVVISAIGASLMPKFSAQLKKGEDTSSSIAYGMKCAHFVGIGGATFILLFAERLLSLLYSGGLSPAQISLSATLLRLSAIGVIYVCYIQIVSTYLQAQGKAHVPALNLLVGGILKAVLTILLLITVGIEGVVISATCSYAVIFALDFAYVYKDFSLIRYKPLLVTLAVSVFATGLSRMTFALPFSYNAVTFIAVIIFVIAYIFPLAIFGVFPLNLNRYPKKNKINKLH